MSEVSHDTLVSGYIRDGGERGQAPVRLTSAEKHVLAGGDGEGARLALEIIAEYGSAVRAPRLIPISRAHVDSCLFHGLSGLDFAERLLEANAKVRVPTTLNVGAVDLLHPELNRGEPEAIERGRRLMAAYRAMGCRATFTCAPYQLADRPRFNEQIAWAESNAIVFVNSVLGARTDRYGDFIDICAAITGKVPEHGLHLSKNRRGEVVFDLAALESAWFSRELLWPLLGLVVGARAGRRIPVIVGAPRHPGEDALKAFGAAAASTGAVALFHVVGATPEAPTLEIALQGGLAAETIQVAAADLLRARTLLMTGRTGPLAAVSVGTPHFSLSEFQRLVGLVERRRRSSAVEFYVSAGRETIRDVERRGWMRPLGRFGIELVADTCTYLKPVIRNRAGVVMTNSAKWAYYAPGNLGYEVVFGSLAECVASAEAGSVLVMDSIPDD